MNVKSIFIPPYKPIEYIGHRPYMQVVLAVSSSEVNTELLSEGEQDSSYKKANNLKELKKLAKKQLNLL